MKKKSMREPRRPQASEKGYQQNSQGYSNNKAEKVNLPLTVSDLIWGRPFDLRSLSLSRSRLSCDRDLGECRRLSLDRDRDRRWRDLREREPDLERLLLGDLV